MNFHAMARALSDDQPVYGLQAVGLNGETPPLTDVETMAATYLDAIRAVRPSGPYFLAGHSFGGEVAFEMARQLQERGEEVGLLALIDSHAPGTLPEDIFARDDAARFMEAARYLGVTLEDAHITPEDLLRSPGIGAHLVPAFRVCMTNLEIRYRPAASVAVPTVVFRAGDGPAAAVDGLGWQAFVGIPITAHTVPGDHFSLLTEPWVGQWAHQLQRHLDGAGRES
jgi:thioesterase domain-containing protein